MHSARHPRPDDTRRLFKPANIVKWYREITGLHRDKPLPRHITYADMLKVVMEHDDSAQTAALPEQSVA